MSSTAWAHLPNAAHIDRVFADVRARPQAWDAARTATRDATWRLAWDAAIATFRGDAARDAAWEAAWDAARDVTWGTAWDAARDVIAALIAWDDCAYILGMPLDAVRALAALGKPAAALLLPAMIALNGASS